VDIVAISPSAYPITPQDLVQTQSLQAFTLGTTRPVVDQTLIDAHAAAPETAEVLAADSVVLSQAPAANVPDALPAPMLAEASPLPRRKQAPSKELFLLHVMAPMAILHAREYANGQPSNPHTYPLNPATPESIAAHQARMAEATGQAPTTQRIVSEGHEALIRHALDLLV